METTSDPLSWRQRVGDDDVDNFDDDGDGDGFGDDEVSVISPRSLEILLCENLIVDKDGLVSKRCCSTFLRYITFQDYVHELVKVWAMDIHVLGLDNHQHCISPRPWHCARGRSLGERGGRRLRRRLCAAGYGGGGHNQLIMVVINMMVVVTVLVIDSISPGCGRD